MNSRPPQKSIAALLWDVIRLGVRTMWGSRVNPARLMIERQQALAVLGLPPNATRQQIKRRYRSLAKRYHPDRGGDQRQLQRIIAAYERPTKDLKSPGNHATEPPCVALERNATNHSSRAPQLLQKRLPGRRRAPH